MAVNVVSRIAEFTSVSRLDIKVLLFRNELSSKVTYSYLKIFNAFELMVKKLKH